MSLYHEQLYKSWRLKKWEEERKRKKSSERSKEEKRENERKKKIQVSETMCVVFSL